MKGSVRICAVALASLLLTALTPLPAFAERFRVLVVMSYEQDFSWSGEIREGIESVLGANSDIHYFYMNTKRDLAGGRQQAEKAWQLYQSLQPDGVITADDNAQQMFVVPWLKDKVSTPVMFCGVNADPEKYGFPAENVSGILERGHIRESIAFLKQLLPSLSSVAFVARSSPSGHAVLDQVRREADTYAAAVCSLTAVSEQTDLQALAHELSGQCDAVYMDGVGGISDGEGGILSYRQVLQTLTSVWQGPVLGANRYHVDEGALSAVIKTGQEQGRRAAEMLLDAMEGKPVTEIAVTRNYRGRRVINVSTMKTLNITPRPITLRGADLVRTR